MDVSVFRVKGVLRPLILNDSKKVHDYCKRKCIEKGYEFGIFDVENYVWLLTNYGEKYFSINDSLYAIDYICYIDPDIEFFKSKEIELGKISFDVQYNRNKNELNSALRNAVNNLTK